LSEITSLYILLHIHYIENISNDSMCQLSFAANVFTAVRISHHKSYMLKREGLGRGITSGVLNPWAQPVDAFNATHEHFCNTVTYNEK
jgi:hypothetical protein